MQQGGNRSRFDRDMMRTLGLLLLPLLLLAGCGSPDAAPVTVDLTVTDPPAATRTVDVPLGATVTLRITTPTDDRVHVHGYEIEADLPAGVATDVTFDASMAGTYEVESHVTDAVWLDLVVR